MKTISGLQVLEKSDFEQICPSFYAINPKPDVTNQYAFINTKEIAAMLWKQKWMPIDAREANAVDASNRGFTKHLVRFAHPDLVMGEDRIELVIYGSHNRSASFQFLSGVFRGACWNNMICVDESFGAFKIRHMGNIQDQVLAAINGIAANTEKVASSINQFQSIELSPDEQGAFSVAAHQAIYKDPDSAPIRPFQLLKTRRSSDANGNIYGAMPKPDLWTTFNVVQENTLKGGLRGFNSAGRRTKTRKVKSIDKDVKLNGALWTLAAEMAKIKIAS